MKDTARRLALESAQEALAAARTLESYGEDYHGTLTSAEQATVEDICSALMRICERLFVTRPSASRTRRRASA